MVSNTFCWYFRSNPSSIKAVLCEMDGFGTYSKNPDKSLQYERKKRLTLEKTGSG